MSASTRAEAGIIRRDFKKRSRIDATCPVHGTMTIHCDIEDDGGVGAVRWMEWHGDCTPADVVKGGTAT